MENKEYISLDFVPKYAQYITSWASIRYKRGDLSYDTLVFDINGQKYTKDNVLTGIQFKDWNSIKYQSSDITGSYQYDVSKTMWWGAGADSVVWPMT
jgi:hypothetical protein